MARAGHHGGPDGGGEEPALQGRRPTFCLLGIVAGITLVSPIYSLAAFAVSAYMEKLEDRRHLTTMSFNRSAFLIQPLTDCSPVD